MPDDRIVLLLVVLMFCLPLIVAWILRSPKPLKVKRLATIEQGATYVLRLTEIVPANLIPQIQRHLDGIGEKYGCRFLLLEPGLEFVEEEEVKE